MNIMNSNDGMRTFKMLKTKKKSKNKNKKKKKTDWTKQNKKSFLKGCFTTHSHGTRVLSTTINGYLSKP